MIETYNLTKRYENGTLAVDALNLKVAAGEIYCLLGANGAGKTTTIHLLLNFIQPTFGEALVNGINVVSNPSEAKRNVAYLAEDVSHYKNLTSRENLEFFATLAGKGVSRADCNYVMRQVGLPESSFDRKVKLLSKGMRQKLGIAVCILKQAPAFVLDEPLAGLDPKAASDIVEILKHSRDEGQAILMSTHDVFRAKEIADRIGIMKEGRKVIERTREDLQYESLEGLYLGYMSGNSDVAPVYPRETIEAKSEGER